MFFRLLAESLRRGSRRKLVAMLAVALGVLSATALAEVLLSAGDRLAAELGSYGANLEVVPAEGEETFSAAGLDRLTEIFWANNLVAVAPLLELRVRQGEQGLVAPLIGTWFEHSVEGAVFRGGLPATRPTLGVEGRWPQEAAAEVAVGRRLARRLGVVPGDPLRVELGDRRRDLTVVALVESGGPEEEQAFAPLAVVQALREPAAEGSPGVAAPDAGADPVTRAEVFAHTNPEAQNRTDPSLLSAEEYETWYCTAYPSSIAHQIDEALPDARARVMTGVTGASAEILGRLRQVILALAIVTLVGAVVGVSAAMVASVLERRLEVGLLVALGAETRSIALFFLTEALLLGTCGGLLGGTLGLAAGRLLGQSVFGVEVPLVPELAPLAAGLGALLAALGGLLPIGRALVRHPVELLKGAET